MLPAHACCTLGSSQRPLHVPTQTLFKCHTHGHEHKECSLHNPCLIRGAFSVCLNTHQTIVILLAISAAPAQSHVIARRENDANATTTGRYGDYNSTCMDPFNAHYGDCCSEVGAHRLTVPRKTHDRSRPPAHTCTLRCSPVFLPCHTCKSWCRRPNFDRFWHERSQRLTNPVVVLL